MVISEMIADVVVVGAGVHGSSAALHLARAGKGTILLEKVCMLSIQVNVKVCTS